MKLFSKNGILTWVLVVLVVANIAVLVTILAKKPPRSKDWKETPPKEFVRGDTAMKEKGWQWRKGIGLEPEQHEKMLELRKKYKAATSALMEEMKQAQTSIFEELQKESPDSAKLDSMARVTGKLHVEMRRESIKHILEIKSITTPEQQQRMIEFMRKHLPADVGSGGGRYQSRHDSPMKKQKN